jgi:glycosyltransferase involved in cell wall biosynthesis
LIGGKREAAGWNSELLRDCLDSIAAQQGTLPDVEVFVADNDPAGRQGLSVAEELAPRFRFPLTGTIVDQPGISAVRNAILEEARDRNVDFIAMIDDDETASPEWIANLLTMQQQTSAGIVGGPVHYSFVSTPHQSVINSGEFQTMLRPSGKTLPLKGSGNFLVSAHSLSKVGWPAFDNDFGLTGGEDSEWFKRLARLGLSFAWATNALTTEMVPPERTTEQWILQRAYRCGNCNVRVAMKHWPSHDLVGKLGRMALTLGSAPILAPLLLVPKRRLWLLRAWWTAAGSAAAIMGRDFPEYADRHSANS